MEINIFSTPQNYIKIIENKTKFMHTNISFNNYRHVSTKPQRKSEPVTVYTYYRVCWVGDSSYLSYGINDNVYLTFFTIKTGGLEMFSHRTE
jgi:hypothetical protein